MKAEIYSSMTQLHNKISNMVAAPKRVSLSGYLNRAHKAKHK